MKTVFRWAALLFVALLALAHVVNAVQRWPASDGVISAACAVGIVALLLVNRGEWWRKK